MIIEPCRGSPTTIFESLHQVLWTNQGIALLNSPEASICCTIAERGAERCLIHIAHIKIVRPENMATAGCETTICRPDCRAFRVQRIIDGDTFVAGEGGRVRLFGMDTPEAGERCFTQAANRLRQLAGTSVKVEPAPRSRDPYDRSLYYVYTNDGESIDEKLIREGLGRAWTRDGEHREVLVELEQQARSDHEGCLW